MARSIRATSLVLGAALLTAAAPTAAKAPDRSADRDVPLAARATRAWQAAVAPASRAGVRPPERCLWLRRDAAVCDIAMLVRVRPSGEVRVCRAVLLVRHAGPRTHARRSSGDCRERAPAP